MHADCAIFVRQCIPCARTNGAYFSTPPNTGTITPNYHAERAFDDTDRLPGPLQHEQERQQLRARH
jgi:hypothetical protein